MINAATPLVTVILSRILMGYKFNRATWIAMIPVCAGSLLCLEGVKTFHLQGVILSCLSLIFRGLRNTLQGYLLGDLNFDPISLLAYVAPLSMFIFLGWSAYREGLAPWSRCFGADSF